MAEAVRVLRPGGRLIGFDVLHSGPLKLLHGTGHEHAEGGATRLLEAGELERHLAQLPVTDVRVRRSIAGLAIRFLATKAS